MLKSIFSQATNGLKLKPSNQHKKIPLHEVFLLQGRPEVTFVEPDDYPRLKAAFRIPGRSVIVEGPSGIGKSTAVLIALKNVGVIKSDDDIIKCRTAYGKELALEVVKSKAPGDWIFDDFHHLPRDTKHKIVDRLKVLADEERRDTKFILIGINNAGKKLVELAEDITLRVQRFSLGLNHNEKIADLLRLGEDALQIEFEDKEAIVKESIGSFQLCHMLAYEACTDSGVQQKQDRYKLIKFDIASIRNRLLSDLHDRWDGKILKFSKGPNFKPNSSHMPYLSMLAELSRSRSWSICLRELGRNGHPNARSWQSIVSGNHLSRFITENEEEFKNFVYWDQDSQTLSLEDHQARYYLGHMDFENLARRCGFSQFRISNKKFVFAFSLTKNGRPFTELLVSHLEAAGIEVYYDTNDLPRSLGKNLKEYLIDIYLENSAIVVPIITKDYYESYWTKFEAEQISPLIDERKLIAIIDQSINLSPFDKLGQLGSLSFNPAEQLEAQAEKIAEWLLEFLV